MRASERALSKKNGGKKFLQCPPPPSPPPPAGYDSNNCETKTPCPNTCSNGGSISGTIVDDDCTCACQAGFSGATCDDATVCTCENGSEATGADCTSSSAICDSCDSDYTKNGNACEATTCEDGFVCQNSATSTGTTLVAGDCGCTCQSESHTHERWVPQPD